MSKVSVQMRSRPDSQGDAELDSAMNPELDTDQGDRRRSDRSQLIVRVNYGTVDEVFSEFTRDINEGGLFIETEKPCTTGTEVTLHFSLPGSDDALQTAGRVVRINPGHGGNKPGMGIEFDDLSDEARTRINELVRSLRARVSNDGDT